MASLHILRKVVPAAIRTVTHGSPLHSAARFAVRIQRIPEITKRTPWAEITSAAFASKSEGEENLLQILGTEIQYALESDPPREDLVPKGAIPFTIEDKPGEQSICLRRKYGDEDIKVEVMPLEIGEQDEEDEDDEERGRSGETHVTMIVAISKGEGRRFLEFICSGYSDEIAIDSMSVREPDQSTDCLYEGPPFSDLDDELQRGFHKYLEVRGIKASLSNFLAEYMLNKDSNEYIRWLRNMKEFVEK
uniref:Mitochondrial glycoprotein n=1 Tax=Araucaria cunninghamii TaxID=56994 RepID=A0A0D6QZS3_ARACU